MTTDMTKLIQHVEEMRARLSQTASTERSLVQQLSDALKRFDQDTLQNVRNVASEHEARRSGILNELHALAASIGKFLPAREPVEPAAIQRQSERTLSYHDEVEANLSALLTQGSSH